MNSPIPLAKPREVLPRPKTPAIPATSPSAEETAPASLLDTGPVVVPMLAARHKSPRGRASILVAGGLVVLLVGLVVAYVVHWRAEREGDKQRGPSVPVEVLLGEITNVSLKKEKVFRLTLPHGVWQADKDLRKGLGAVIALQRSEPDAWLAIVVKDYGTRKPRDAELIQEAMDRLESCFGTNLEVAPTPERKELPGLPGQQAHRLEFRGKLNEVSWRGECYLFTQQGLGYWLFVGGAPGLQEAQEALAAVQQGKGFEPYTARRGWREQPPEMETFQAKDVAFRVRAPKGVWSGDFNAKDEDADGVLYLHGRDRKENDPRLKNIKSATVLVLAWKKKLDAKEALAQARATLAAKMKAENADYRLVLAEKADAQTEQGHAADVGDRRGRLVELRLAEGEMPVKYLLLAVVPGPERVFAIVCTCRWQHRQVWRSDFLDLLATVRL